MTQIQKISYSLLTKGGPGLESRTGSRLVSPATGHEKKKWTCHQNDPYTFRADADAPKAT